MTDAAFNYHQACSELMEAVHDAMNIDVECPGPNWLKLARRDTEDMRRQLRRIEQVLEAAAAESFKA